MTKRRIRITIQCNECQRVYYRSPETDAPDCPKCGGADWDVIENPREKGDDDSVEYADPREAREERDRHD
jgi:predicted  nucleic acid-binding Zn-ribbon protein